MSRAVNHIIYIRNAISEIRQWTIQGEAEFKKNIVLFKATLYNLQTLAESTSLLPDRALCCPVCVSLCDS